jgi:hypothetical protein
MRSNETAQSGKSERNRRTNIKAFEHALLLLILFLGLLSARPLKQRLTVPILAVGLLLAFLPPVLPLDIPWRLALLVTVPLLMWQSARRLVHAGWWNARLELALWGFASILFVVPFVLAGSLGVLSALLLGMLLGSILWRAGEGEEFPSFVSQIGPLTLIILLVETAPQVETPIRYLGGVASGLALGISIAAAATWLVGRVTSRWQNVIALGQVYLAFAIGTAIEISAVAAALASVVGYFCDAQQSLGGWKDAAGTAQFLARISSTANRFYRARLADPSPVHCSRGG